MSSLQLPSVSIIIVSWNSQGVLPGCLDSIIRHLQGLEYEVIIVDNHSGDTSYLEDYTRHGFIKVLENTENLGYAKAVNRGLRHAAGEFHLVLNPDMVFVSDPVSPLISILNQDRTIGVIGPLLRGTDGVAQIAGYYPRFPSVMQLLLSRTLLSSFRWAGRLSGRFFHGRIAASGLSFVDQIPGAFFLFRKGLFGDAPAMNEVFFIWMEDVDFCLRVKNRGLKTAVCADISVVHIGGTSFKMWSDPEKYLAMTESYVNFLKIHHTFPRIACDLTLLFINAGVLSVFHRIKAWSGRGTAESVHLAAAFAVLMKSLPGALFHYRRIRTGELSGAVRRNHP